MVRGKELFTFEYDAECNPSDKKVYYDIAAAYAAQHKPDSAFQYLSVAAAADSGMFRITDGIFHELQKLPQWKDFVDHELAEYEAKFGSIPRRDIALKLCEMGISDQAFFSLMAFYPDSASHYMDKRGPINESNLKMLEEIVNEMGWPTYSLVGFEFSSSAFLVVQHADDVQLQKYYLKMIRKAVQGHDFSKQSLAYLTDRIRIKQGKKQLYGTQMEYVDGEFVMPPVSCPYHLN